MYTTELNFSEVSFYGEMVFLYPDIYVTTNQKKVRLHKSNDCKKVMIPNVMITQK